MCGRNGVFRSLGALLVVIILVQSSTLLLAEDGDAPADPFGPPEGPIPFPIYNVSGSYEEDRFPYVYSDESSIRVLWNKGAREMFVYHVVQREFDGETWQEGEDWVSVIDTKDQDFIAHEHYSHEGMAVRYDDKVYFVFASDDQNYTTGTDHDIAIRWYDPAREEWGPITEVTPNDEGQDREPRAVVHDGKLVIAWRTNDPKKAPGDADDIVLRTYDGAAFSAIVPVSIDEVDTMDSRLDLAVVAGNVSIVWEWNNRTDNPSDWDVLYREWNGTGFTARPVTLAPDPRRVSKLPRITSLDGSPFVVWESRPPTGQPGPVRIRGCTVVNGIPGELVEVTSSSSSAENVQPDVVSVGGKAYILWSSFDDSLTHGPDSDIVMRQYDGHVLGDVIEVSHPRDGPEVNEGFVTACIFQDNLYAVWRMMYPVDPGLPLDVPVNEDIVMRRVTDYRVDMEIPLEENPRVGDTIPIEINSTTFYGRGVNGQDLGLEIVVKRGSEVLSGSVTMEVIYTDGLIEASYEPEKKGSYTFLVLMDGREMASESLTVHGTSTGDDEGISVYIYYTLGALVLLAIALVIGLKRRD